MCALRALKNDYHAALDTTLGNQERISAIRSLAASGHPNRLLILEQLASRGSDSINIIQTALGILAQQPQSEASLLRVFKTTPRPEIAQLVLVGFLAISTSSKNSRRAVLDAIRKHRFESVQLAAIRSITSAHDIQTVSALVSAAHSNASDSVRIAALNKLSLVAGRYPNARQCIIEMTNADSLVLAAHAQMLESRFGTQ